MGSLVALVVASAIVFPVLPLAADPQPEEGVLQGTQHTSTSISHTTQNARAECIDGRGNAGASAANVSTVSQGSTFQQPTNAVSHTVSQTQSTAHSCGTFALPPITDPPPAVPPDTAKHIREALKEAERYSDRIPLIPRS